MLLSHLSLENFRNYEHLELALAPGHHLFLGRNGEGKTNILEAIHLLGTAGSQRASRDQILIREGTTGFRVGARLEKPEENTSIRVEVTVGSGSPKRIRLDKENARASDLLATVKVVSFAPSDVELVQASAKVRRKFLDLIGSQLSPEYLQLLREYQKAVRQRNETLSRSFVYSRGRPSARTAREPWTDLVVELGAEMFERRTTLVERLRIALLSITEDAFRGAGPVGVSYEPGVPLEGGDPKDALREALSASEDKDEAVGYTTEGPHTDDLRLELGGRDLRRYGSLGQQQLSAMFLKLSQADLVRTVIGAPPLLLVDEMFAILDRRAAEEFLARVEGEGQIFLATAQEGWLGELRERGFHVHQVRAGTVESESLPAPPDVAGNPETETAPPATGPKDPASS